MISDGKFYTYKSWRDVIKMINYGNILFYETQWILQAVLSFDLSTGGQMRLANKFDWNCPFFRLKTIASPGEKLECDKKRGKPMNFSMDQC